MDPHIIISPDYTEISTLSKQIETVEGIRLIKSDDELEYAPRIILLDFTFDFFRKKVNPTYLYGLFAELQTVLQSIRLMETKIYVMKNYPFSTSFRHLLMVEKIISQFIHLLIEYYDARLILLPDLISRYSFNDVEHPALKIIDAVRMGKGARLPVTESSRVCILYAPDFLHVLMENLDNGVDSHLVIEGNEMTLKHVQIGAQEVAGIAPIQYDSNHFIQYHYPNVTGVAVSHINYGIENIMIDLMNRLF